MSDQPEKITLHLKIEVRMKHGKRRQEVWTRQHTPKTGAVLTEADFVPFILQKEVDTTFGTSVKRESFTVESFDQETRTVTFKEASFARSDWFYQNIQNFGFERIPV